MLMSMPHQTQFQGAANKCKFLPKHTWNISQITCDEIVQPILIVWCALPCKSSVFTNFSDRASTMIRVSNRCYQNAGAILKLVMAGDLAKIGVCPIEHHTLNLIKRSSESSCQLGINTILSLGIIPDNRWSKHHQWSLYGAIEPSLKTRQGRRLLRASLLQPLISVSTILERQNAIAELAGAHMVQVTVQEFLATAPRDVHKCIPALPLAAQGDTLAKANLTTSSMFIQSVLRLRTLLSAVEVHHASSGCAVYLHALDVVDLLAVCSCVQSLCMVLP
jgi:hypothetical protein